MSFFFPMYKICLVNFLALISALCFCAAVTAEIKSVSVMKGETATLKSNVTELWRDDEILLWL